MKKNKNNIIKLVKKKKLYFSYENKIIIRDLILNFKLGYYSSEKINKQRVRFNLIINFTNQKPKNDSDIRSIVNYKKVVTIISNLVRKKHFNFLESLAEAIFDELFKNRRILKIMLRIEKLDILKETSSVGIEITKKRENV
jgi:dihydroneopterin aldolase